MDNRDILLAAYQALEKVAEEYLETLDGIPDIDLNTWLPSAEQNGGGEFNTLAAMSVHTALAGTWTLVHQVFGQELKRERDKEFTATASREEINELFAAMLGSFRDLIESDSSVDFSAPPPTPRPEYPGWNRLTWLYRVIHHTGLHLGHAQITRQLWLAERTSA